MVFIIAFKEEMILSYSIGLLDWQGIAAQPGRSGSKWPKGFPIWRIHKNEGDTPCKNSFNKAGFNAAHSSLQPPVALPAHWA
jgi:hypothetical protein